MKRLVVLLLLGLPLFARSPEEVLAAARAEGLPASSLEERLREGRAKGIEDPELVAALERRRVFLSQARKLLRTENYPLAPPPVQELWITLARVLEGGMSAEHATSVLRSAEGSQAGRLTAALEAGEAMRLGGVDADACSRMMQTFIQQDWTRAEILRAARTARQLAGSGKSSAEIEESLQKSSPAGAGQGQRIRGGRGRKGPPED